MGCQPWGAHRQAHARHEDGVWSVALSPDGTRSSRGVAIRRCGCGMPPVVSLIGAPLRGHEDWVLSGLSVRAANASSPVVPAGPCGGGLVPRHGPINYAKNSLAI